MNENLNTGENMENNSESKETEQNSISLIPSTYKQIETYEPINTSSQYEQITQNTIFSSEKINTETTEKNNIKKEKKYDFPSDIFSLITFKWVYNTISLIKEYHKIKFHFLGKVSKKYKSKEILNEIKTIWYGKYYNMLQNNIKENNKSIFPLLMALIKANIWRIFFCLLIFFLMSGLDFIGVLVFEELLGRFKEKKSENSRWVFLENMSLYKLVFFMIVYKLLILLSDRHAMFISELLSFRTKSQLNLLIYDKLLKIPMYNTGKFNEGQIINLFQIDSEAFGELIIYTTYIIMVPFRVIYSVYLLFVFFKLAFIPGILVLIILGVIFTIYGKKEEQLQNDNMKATDERMNITSTTFDIIKIIKLYSWEKIFRKKINDRRKNEIDVTKKKLNVQKIITSINWCVEDALSLVCIIFYNLIYGQMEIEVILTSFFIIGKFVDPLFSLPDFFIYLFEAIVSMRRIQDFLLIKEHDYQQIEFIKNKEYPYSVEINHVDFGVEKTFDNENSDNKENQNDGNNNKLIPKEMEMENLDDSNDDNEHLILSTNLKNDLVNKNYNPNKKNFKSSKNPKIQKIILLKDINLQIKKGEHIGIIGEVGSGKTCLLNAFINNLQVFSKNNSKGNIKLSGKISFVSQNPWILNTTVEENILFFSPKDEEKYKKIISVCQLEPDFSTLQKGDQTEIGEKGLNLSGGQKARISIARAIYSDSEIYIFDDPLSALDAYVGMNLFKGVFNEYLKDKTFIITTHALQYLNFFDRIIYMEDGKIQWSGTYNEIINQEFYAEFVKSIERKKSGEIQQIKKKDSKEEKEEKEDDSENTEEEFNSSSNNIIKYERKKSLLELESLDKISFNTLFTLLKYSGGFFYVFKILSVNILWKACEVYSDYYLSSWSSIPNLTSTQNNIKLIIYTFITGSGIICVIFRQHFMRQAYLKCYIQIHDLLIDKLLNAPVNLFHDITPRGNIITRLSKDLQDSARINNILSGTIRVIFQIFGSILVCAIFNIWTLPLIILIFIAEVYFSLYILQPIREISRMEGRYRTPVIGVFSESIYGLHIIRSFQFENNFVKKFNKRMNDYFKILIYQSGISGWYGINIDLISFILLTFILISCCLFKEKYDSKSIGLLLTYSINLIEHLFDFMQRFSRLSKIFVSLERCENYTKILQEKYPVLESDKNLKQYPTNNNKVKTFISEGKINFNNFSVKYRPNTPLVLKKLNFEINPKEKIGVVGRTGSGKSTLCLCMFRLLEASEGNISIDDIDISKIGLEILRKNLTIIPQEPTLIEGTLKENVDPEQIFDDEKIMAVLKDVGLDDFMEGKNLEYKIENNGNNISIGEKQLICIARALIKKTKIILMDEATANIDYKTETFLQNSINKELKDCTVITIAHRIKTIINYDKILVLNNGEIAEYDSPKNLLEKKGLFYQLYKESVV